jgi:UDP-glucose 4-epimerase
VTAIYEGQTVLVTGGLGFLGRNLVDALLDESVRHVIVVDDCSNSSSDIPEHWTQRVEHIDTSVTDSEWLGRIPEVNTVFHFACKTLLECRADPVTDAEVNAVSTLRMLEYLRRLDGPAPTLVYPSSVSVYGVTPARAIDENFATHPCSQYGVSKLAAEKYVQMYAARYGLYTAITRLSNVYGPGQTPRNPYCGVVGIFLEQAATGRPLTVIDDGTQVRDFTFVTDAIRAVLWAGADPSARGRVFNVSSGRPTSIRELADEIRRLFPGVTIEHRPASTIDSIRHRVIDSSEIRKLGWRSTTSLRSGLEHTVDHASPPTERAAPLPVA